MSLETKYESLRRKLLDANQRDEIGCVNVLAYNRSLRQGLTVTQVICWTTSTRAPCEMLLAVEVTSPNPLSLLLALPFSTRQATRNRPPHWPCPRCQIQQLWLGRILPLTPWELTKSLWVRKTVLGWTRLISALLSIIMEYSDSSIQKSSRVGCPEDLRCSNLRECMLGDACSGSAQSMSEDLKLADKTSYTLEYPPSLLDELCVTGSSSSQPCAIFDTN